MRGDDPVSCPTVRRWWSAVRDRVAAWSAFACPDAAAVAALAKFVGSTAGVLEIGAGSADGDHRCIRARES